MSVICYEYLRNEPLVNGEVIGGRKINGSYHHVCAWKGKQDLLTQPAPLYIYLAKDGEFYSSSNPCKELTHLKIWTVWEKRADLEPESKEGLCSLREDDFVQDDSILHNVFHVEAVVVGEEKKEIKEGCLAVKRIAYELFRSSPGYLTEMHFSLTRDDSTGIARDADDFEIIRSSWEERSVGWGRSFKMKQVEEYPSILG